jgi:hypothetical protein
LRSIVILVAVLTAATTTSATAQWLNHPTPGLPRLANGRIDLAAPAPRAPDGHPDLTGLWSFSVPPSLVGDIATDLKPGEIQPWAAALFAQRMSEFGKDDPSTIGCLPLGPRHVTGGGLRKIVQTPALILILHEDLAYRQVFMDGRPLPTEPNPSFMGYSVGRWDGDTLVVESSGFNDRTWLDFGGHPHTEALRTTERYRRTSVGRIEREVTLEDRGAFNAPITIRADMTLAPDTDLLEYVCNENPRDRDRAHLVGRTADERRVVVPPELLAKYVGIYDLERPAGFGIRTIEITREGDQLWVALNGRGRLPMTPLSNRMFSPRLIGTYEFVMDGQGTVTHLLTHSAEEVVRANKRR